MFNIPENIATIYYKISLCVFQYQYCGYCRRRADWDIPAQSRSWRITAQTNKYTKSTYWSGLGHHDKASTATHRSDHWLLTRGCHWSCGGSVSVTHVWQAIDEGAVRYSSSGLLRDVSSTLESQQQNPVNSYFPVFIVTWVWPRSHRKRKLSLGCFTKTPPTTLVPLLFYWRNLYL